MREQEEGRNRGWEKRWVRGRIEKITRSRKEKVERGRQGGRVIEKLKRGRRF